MKKLVSAALAGSLAFATVAASTAGASAKNWHNPGPPPPHYVKPTNPGAAIAAGAFLGLALGALVAPRPVYPYPYTYVPPPAPVVYPPSYYYPPAYPAYPVTSAHATWCRSQFGTAYNPWTDTWVDAWGVQRRCIAPY